MRSISNSMVTLGGWLLILLPASALAAPAGLCAGLAGEVAADGRVFGHLPYGEAAAGDLVVAPPGFAVGQACRLHRAAAIDLARLLGDADRVPGVAGTLRGVSCFRGIDHQRSVFCARIGSHDFPTEQSRAQFVAPPGYSEHATGYAVDFGVRPSPGCRDVDSCIIGQPGGRWLLANAARYGFELSFPAFNRQRVSWEPWHWRWVGTSAGVPGAIVARSVFARARSDYPANPGLIDPPPVRRPDPPPLLLLYPRLPGI